MKLVFDEHRGDQQQMEDLNVNLHFKWKTVDCCFISEANWMEKEVDEKTKQKQVCLTPKIPKNNDMNQTGRAMWQNLIVHLAITLKTLLRIRV